MADLSAAAIAAAIGGLMESALLGEGWAEALEGFAHAAGARGAVLVTEGPRAHRTILSSPEIAEPVARYVAGKAPPDPRASRVWPARTGGFVTDFDTFTRDEIKRDPFYAEFLRPIGVGWHACAYLNEWGSDARVHISLKRDLRVGHYESSDIRLLDTTLPSLRMATSIAKARLAAETSGYAQALGASGEGVFEIDSTGRVLRANDAAADLLDGDLFLVHGRLAAARGDNQRKLDRALAAALARPPDAGFAALTTESAEKKLLVRVVPVLGEARSLFGAAVALAVVETWRRPGAPSPFLSRALREAFGLTQMEAQVAALIAGGLGPGGAAKVLGIAEGTARNHLKSAMAKAGVARQAELAALAASLTL